jgi:hypothetical protein
MNVEKLAKHLKEFTLDEIEMIAECDCKTNLEHLLNSGKILFEQGLYKYIEVSKKKTFELYPKPVFRKNNNLLFGDVAQDYLINRKLTKDTLKGYKSQLKYNILPYFGKIQINEITYEMIVDFMQNMKEKYKPKTASNGVTLLGSILKYAFEQGLIKHNPYYVVKNSMCR